MDLKLKYKVFIGEKHAKISHELMDNVTELYAIKFAEWLIKNNSVSGISDTVCNCDNQQPDPTACNAICENCGGDIY